MIRFSLAILFAVLVAASRPVATGGHHDFLAVGVVVEKEGAAGPQRRLVLSIPTPESLAAFDALLRTGSRTDLLRGEPIEAGPPPADPATGEVVRELVYYGRGTRAGRAPLRFEGSSTLGADSGAGAAALGIARLTPAVTAASARVLLGSEDHRALADALDALVAVRSDVAAAEALAIAGDRSKDAARRVLAVRALWRLGGPAAHREAFEALVADPDAHVAEEAKADLAAERAKAGR
ncbi:MAG: hypothetical protein L6R43_09615 [Planctomycetes bacterium]|nr:hypothetical protein [Planctomycetota bacterium]